MLTSLTSSQTSRFPAPPFGTLLAMDWKIWVGCLFSNAIVAPNVSITKVNCKKKAPASMTHSTTGNSTAIQTNKQTNKVWSGTVMIDLPSTWKLNFVHKEKKLVDDKRPWFKSEEQMGHVQRHLSRAHEQVLIKMAQEEVTEGFKMSSLTHTKTLWQNLRWEDYNWKSTKVRVLKQVCMVYTGNSTIMVRVTWSDNQWHNKLRQ